MAKYNFNYFYLKAREDIEGGDVVIGLWKNWCRRGKADDLTTIGGFAGHDVKRGEPLKIVPMVSVSLDIEGNLNLN